MGRLWGYFRTTNCKAPVSMDLETRCTRAGAFNPKGSPHPTLTTTRTITVTVTPTAKIRVTATVTVAVTV